ncbi:MAG: hypothetical protein ACI4PT_05880 [Candidatus Avoscillospira sp.]
MRNKTLKCILLSEAVLCLVLCCLRESFAGWFTTLMAFPLEQIGLLLRRLSLSGAAGNGAAIGLYVLLCLLPVLCLLLVRRRRKLLPEDAIVGLLCPVLFGTLYLMVNPGQLGTWLGAPGELLGKALLGGAVWAMVCAYAVLRLLRLFFRADGPRLRTCANILLWVLALLLTYGAFGAAFGSFLDSVESARAANTGGGLGLTYGFLGLQWLVDALPYVLDLWVVFAALDVTAAERYSEAMTEAADRLAKWCCRTLTWTVLTNCGFNLLQLLFARYLRVVNGVVLLPVYSIAFTLAALLLARLLKENRELKADNDLFV